MKLGYSILIIVIVAAGIYLLSKDKAAPAPTTENTSMTTEETKDDNMPVQEDNGAQQGPLMKIMKEGAGSEAKTGDTVSVHYSGYLEDGTKFDSSVDRGTPFEFTLGENRVIQGWEIGVLGMKVGEVRRLVIPPQFAYGENGFPPVIPANATLAFEVELIAINPAE